MRHADAGVVCDAQLEERRVERVHEGAGQRHGVAEPGELAPGRGRVGGGCGRRRVQGQDDDADEGHEDRGQLFKRGGFNLEQRAQRQREERRRGRQDRRRGDRCVREARVCQQIGCEPKATELRRQRDGFFHCQLGAARGPASAMMAPAPAPQGSGVTGLLVFFRAVLRAKWCRGERQVLHPHVGGLQEPHTLALVDDDAPRAPGPAPCAPPPVLQSSGRQRHQVHDERARVEVRDEVRLAVLAGLEDGVDQEAGRRPEQDHGGKEQEADVPGGGPGWRGCGYAWGGRAWPRPCRGPGGHVIFGGHVKGIHISLCGA